MIISFLRHLKTKGNYEGRYIGKTDEDLFKPEEQRLLRNLPDVKIVFSSPMKRCLQTVELLYPAIEPVVINDFREIDFGDFENRNYDELKNDPSYRLFLDSGGTGIIPNGDEVPVYRNRCCEAFVRMIRRLGADDSEEAIVVCHGGTIMSILERFDEEKKSFYDYRVANGCGFVTEYDTARRRLRIIRELK
jgi:alpha-ribazole phosphatase